MARNLFDISLVLCNRLEGDPLSPPEGEATQGEHPLDPLHFRGYINLLKNIGLSS